MKHFLQNISFLPSGLFPKLLVFSMMLIMTTLLTCALFLNQILKELMENQLGKQALSISQTISMLPQVIELVETKDPEGKLQELISHIERNIDAEFIVIGDSRGIRIVHPHKDRIGKKMMGDDNSQALKYGRSYVSKSIGTLGPSIRGKSPIFNKNWEIIGVVSVGYLDTQIQNMTQVHRKNFIFYLYIALFFAIMMAILLSAKIKSTLLGYEPKEISRLFLEKQAIINAVKAAIVATNKEGEITLFNDVAKEYFNLEDSSTTLPHALHKILLTCKEIKDADVDIDGVEYICTVSPVIQDDVTVGMVASFRKKDEIDLLVWELSRVKQYSERLREKKHEFSNLLHLVSGYIQMGQYDQAIKCITQGHLADEKIIEHYQNALHDPIVASIFIGKYYFAFEKGVKIILDENSSIQDKIDPAISKYLLKILGNIINNAIDAAKLSEKKEVTLFATDIGNDIIFDIEDSGAGINEALKEKIFEKGFTTKGELHSGYGLYFVKSTLELLGGFISIEKGENSTIMSIHIPKGTRK